MKIFGSWKGDFFWVGSRGEAGQQGGTEIDRLEMEGESTEQ